VLAILFREEGYEAFEAAIADAPSCSISAASLVEVSMVVSSRDEFRALRQFDALLREAGISVEPVTEMQALLAREGFLDYGKGRPSAGLNFGDCFSYALAKATGEPLLFKGDDFRKTDVEPALP
jgi:ribonuclease VapC